MTRFDIADVLEIDAYRFHNKNTPVRWNYKSDEEYRAALNEYMAKCSLSADLWKEYLMRRRARFLFYLAAGNRSSRRWAQELERLHNEMTGFYELIFEDESLDEEEF